MLKRVESKYEGKQSTGKSSTSDISSSLELVEVNSARLQTILHQKL
jgi:hypothetical protein